MNHKFVYLSIFFLIISLSVFGQSSYVFRHLNIDNGLSNNNVKALLEDSYGFLWVGTMSGLNRYDGYEFKKYSLSFNNENFNDISSLQEDGLGNIWISNGFGYVVYCREKDKFIIDTIKLLEDYGVQVKDDYRIYVDNNRNLWVLSFDRIYFYDTHNKEGKIILINPSIIESCVDISDNDSFLFLILDSGELWRLCKESEVLANIESPCIGNEAYDKIYADKQQGLWIFSHQTDLIYYKKSELHQWRLITLHSEIETKSHGVRDVLDDGKGCIWIGTDHKGIFIYERASETLKNILFTTNDNTSIASNHVACLYQDKNETIWIGHNKVGLSYCHDSFRKFITVKYPNCSDITSVMEDRNGNIWLGTDGYGLYIEGKNGTLRKFPIFNSSIIALLEDQKGRIWISSYMNGLFCFENGKLHKFIPQNNELASNVIWGLLEDRYGKIWISSIEALQCLDPDNGTISSILNVDGEYIHSISTHYDGGDKLYVCTPYGLYTIDIVTGKQFLYLGNKKGTQIFKSPYISNTYKSKNNQLFLAHTNGLTIWDLNTDSLYYMDEETGLCNNVIQAITEDNDEKIWVTTSNGVSVLSITKRERGKLNILPKNYSIKDGLMNGNFNGNSIYKLKNGNIVLGGIDGYVLVNPNKVSEKMQLLPKIVFTELSIGNTVIHADTLYNDRKILDRPIEQTSSLLLSHEDKFISLEYMTGDLLDVDNVLYAYKLQGFNDQWIYTRENKANFSYLPPGKYEFFVKARNGEGEWGNETVLYISIIPPFYQTVWAYLLFAFIALGIVVYFVFWIKKRHREKLEQQKIEFEHQQKIYLSEMKLNFFTNISHDLRTPLTLILTPLQIMLNEVSDSGIRKKLSVIQMNAQHLLELINTLLDFRKLDVGAETLHCKQGDIIHFVKETCTPFYDYAAGRNMRFSFSCGIKTFPMSFDSDKVRKILNNLLSNAFKYTPDGGNVTVGVYLEKNMLCIKVADTGLGIPDKDKKHIFERFYQTHDDNSGNGIGLNIASEYVLLHGGEISVQDNKPCGSIFTVCLPVTMLNGEEMNHILSKEYNDYRENRANSKPILLLVDDNNDFCEFLADSLANEYIVKVAKNGLEALNIARCCDVDIIVSDVMMPVMNGIELCREIKTDVHLSHIPIILLTARTADENQLEGLELGADDYITKPFNLDILKLRIKRFIEWTKRCHYEFKEKMDISPSEITITTLDEQLIEKAIKIVEENIADPNFTVESLSESLGLSRSHLYKKLMFITGKGPAEFIRIIRLKRGRQLLEKSQMQIAEIAYAVGFNSPKRFTQNFKNEFGMSPSEFLKGLKCL